MRLHHEELTFFSSCFFSFGKCRRRSVPQQVTPGLGGETLPRQGSSCGGEVGALGPSHILELLLLLDIDPKTHSCPQLGSWGPATFLIRGTPPMQSPDPALY